MVAMAKDIIIANTPHEPDSRVDDEAEKDTTVVPTLYKITSFGADYDVEGLVRRLNREEIFVPHFQRDFVWTMPEASRLVESMLLGLPVPGIFLAREADTNKLLVIDGQQRLKSLQFFCNGYFAPDPASATKRVFKLTKVQAQYEGKTYEGLSDADRRQLEGSIIHATIVKQDAPVQDDTSIYQIFERLNTGGRKLMPQEIRVASYHGELLDLIDKLNNQENWRKLYGKKSNRLKDEELILRFLAMRFRRAKYIRPMVDFVNKFASTFRHASADKREEFEKAFTDAIDFVYGALDAQAFRLGTRINAAIFDSVMTGVSERITAKGIPSIEAFKRAYQELLEDADFVEACSTGTSNEGNVILRTLKAVTAFSQIE